MMLTTHTTSFPSARLFQRVLFAFLTLLAPVLAWAQVSDAQRDYVLGAGDVIRVSVYQNADLTLETRVAESGSISFPPQGMRCQTLAFCPLGRVSSCSSLGTRS